MANENKKNFNEMLNQKRDMPKIIELDDLQAKKWGGKRMIIVPPLCYDEKIKKIPFGELTTTNDLRRCVARENNVDVACPLTAGIFINICAWASYQRKSDITPYWRVLKADGELNIKYPEAFELQIKLLQAEGHTIITKGNKNIKYFVKDYEKSLYNFGE